jgi:hypothetical protein
LPRIVGESRVSAFGGFIPQRRIDCQGFTGCLCGYCFGPELVAILLETCEIDVG